MMARAGPKIWRYRAGKRPNTVTVSERVPGGVIYAKAWKRSTGQYVRLSLRHRDRKAAELYADEEALKLKKGEPGVRVERVTLGRVLKLYGDNRTPEKSPRVQAMDAARSELWVRYLGVNKDPHSLTKHEWDSFVRQRASGELDARGRAADSPRPVRARTIEQDQRFLAAVFTWACSWQQNGARLMSFDKNPLTDRRTFPFESEKNPRRGVATENRYERTRAVTDQIRTGRWVIDPADPGGKKMFVSRPSQLSEILDLAHHTGRRVSAILVLTFADLRLQRSTEAPHGCIHWTQDSDKMNREWLTPISIEVRAVLESILRERPAIGSHPLFPSVSDPAVPVTYRVAATWLRKAEALAGLAPLQGALWHAYRRKWASERKHLPDADVADMGGWSCVDTLRIYQRPDAETRQRVLTDRRPIRDIS
jgi:hypothetical protein